LEFGLGLSRGFLLMRTATTESEKEAGCTDGDDAWSYRYEVVGCEVGCVFEPRRAHLL